MGLSIDRMVGWLIDWPVGRLGLLGLGDRLIVHVVVGSRSWFDQIVGRSLGQLGEFLYVCGWFKLVGRSIG